MTEQPTGTEKGKHAAAAMALDEVRSGMALGLGSGSTANIFVRLLAERMAEGLAVTCVATTQHTAVLARECGIAVLELDEVGRLDLTVDGADEIDPDLALIKGGGGCHLIEKIVAAASDRLLVIADESKLVDRLGAFPLPIEVATFGWQSTRRRIEATLDGVDVGARAVERRMHGTEPFVTDEMNFILDARLERIGDAPALAAALSAVPGTVEHGLFIGMAEAAMIGGTDGSARIVRPGESR